MKQFIKLGTTELSEIGQLLLAIEWDFKAAREQDAIDAETHETMSRGTRWVDALADAFRHTMDAANAIGWLEHTCDWDPFLIIDLANGDKIDTDSHYYLVNDVIDGVILIEAPEAQDRDGGSADKYWVDHPEHGPCYRFEIKDIDYIKVDPQ